MQVFHWSRHYDYGQLQKSGVGDQKSTKKGGKNLGQFHFHDRTWYIQACLEPEAKLPWGSGFLYRTSLETTRTSPKPITDKL